MNQGWFEHRRMLTDGWSVWSCVWVRAAGFPAELVLGLATEGSAETAARLAGIEAGGQDAAGERADLREQLAAQLGHESEAAMARIRELMRGGPMREALVWQDRGLVRATLEAFLRRPLDPDDAEAREQGGALATYVQRYCVGNQSHGFFGPVGWARWIESPEPVALTPATELVAERGVYFEHRAIDALAARLSADPSLRVHLAPRRIPSVRLDGPVLRYGVGRSAELPEVFVRVMNACDGQASAAVVAARVLSDPSMPLSGVDEVMDIIEELAAVHLVTWTLEVPTAQPHPEGSLRRQLEEVRAPAARGPALAALDQLEAARDAVTRAAGDADRLAGALDALDATFIELTGAPPMMAAGPYGAPGIVYEDCRRAGQLLLGSGLRERVAGPLSLLLHSARWYTHEIGRRYRALFDQVHAELRAERGDARIELLRFRERVDPHLSASDGGAPAIVREVAAELVARWTGILSPPAGQRVVRRRGDQLRDAVAAAFGAPCPGWPEARYHSPDLLIAADGVDAIARGDYQVVVGGLHTAVNGLLSGVALAQHPRPLDLVLARELDDPRPGVAPVVPREQASRTDPIAVARHDLHLETGDTRSWRPRHQVLAIADMFVEPYEDRLVVTSLDGRHEFDVVAFFEHDLTAASAGQFRTLSPAAHTPRVAIDDLVVAREEWRFEASALEFATAATPFDRLIAAQAWRQQHGLPRWVFVTTPREPAPLYVDLSSSVYVENLARRARGSGSLHVSEMLPHHGQTWLADAAGQRYTCELRMAAVDPEPWRPG